MLSQLNLSFVLVVAVLVALVFRPPLHGVGFFSKNKNKLNASIKQYGIDVSHHQGQINWPLVKDNISFAFIKATEGTDFVDPRYVENSKGIIKEGLLSGAYHFYKPTQDPIKQAEHFITTSQPLEHKLRPVLDIEITDGQSAKEISSGALEWLKHVEKKIDCKPMIYTYASYWDDYLGNEFDNYNYWIAAWTSKNMPVPPKKRDNWQLWQFSDNGQVKGIKGSVDRDLFDGTKQKLDEILCP